MHSAWTSAGVRERQSVSGECSRVAERALRLARKAMTAERVDGVRAELCAAREIR